MVDWLQTRREFSHVGYDDHSTESDATLWTIPAPEPRVGWSSDALILFCGDEPPSVMDEDDATWAEGGDI